jgi:hypothetical protein
MRPDGAIREKWRILNGKEDEWSDLKFGAPRWYVLMHTRHMESPNWVAMCVAEMEANLPYLMGVQWDSAWASHGVSTEAYAWTTCTRARWALIVSLTTSWTVATRGALRAYMCHIVRFIPLQGWLLIQISMTPSDMGDGLFAESKRSNSTFIMLYLYHEMVIDYLVVDEMINIKIVWSQLHAWNRMQTYDVNYLNLANNMLKSI